MLALERPLLVALDVDGTLAPIVRNPDEAAIPKDTLQVLRALASLPTVELALITGRDFESLTRMERLDGIWRGVEHGGLVIGPGEQPQRRQLEKAHEVALARFREWVSDHAEDAFVEYKPRAVAVHVRAIAETDPARANKLLDEAEELAAGLGLHVRKGRCVREAEVLEHSKGEALREIFERSGARSTFFAGDDVTDIPAIEFASTHGIGAFVLSAERPHPPIESMSVIESAREVAQLLAELSDRLA